MSDALSLPQLLTPAGTERLQRLLAEITAAEMQVVAVHDPETGFAVFVEVVAGLPVLWRVTGPVLPAQASCWFQSLAESFGANPASRAN